MRFAFLACLTLASAAALAVEPSLGNYRLRVPDEAIRVAKLAGRPVPFGRLAILSGGRFALETDASKREGRYRVDNDHLILVDGDGKELMGEVRGSRVTVEGLAFEKEDPAVMIGIWTVRRNGIEDKKCRIELKADGKFKFTMVGASSEGTWSLVDGRLVFVWTRIDDQPIEDGLVIRKEILPNLDGISFNMDTFRYERASGN